MLLLLAMAGFIGGAALIGVWAIGLAVMAVSVAGAYFALFHDWPDVKPGVHMVPAARSVADVLERARAAS
jgi:uncharacterized membrane protein